MPKSSPSQPEGGEDKTQRTRKGLPIPLPERQDVMRDLRRVSRRKPAGDESDARGAEDEG